MKKRKRTIHICIGILVCVLLATKYILQASLLITPLLNMFDHEAASIGLIGGADGPVSFFVSFPLGSFFLMPIIELIGIVYILMLLIQFYRKSKTQIVDDD